MRRDNQVEAKRKLNERMRRKISSMQALKCVRRWIWRNQNKRAVSGRRALLACCGLAFCRFNVAYNRVSQAHCETSTNLEITF
jgi:hypothetical protein